MALTHASYSSALGLHILDEFCSEAGIISPTKKNLTKMYKNYKKAIQKISLDQLCQNRKNHVSACRASSGYAGDLTISLKGKDFNVARGAAVTDGAGNTRAYNHLICGSQHCLVVFSLITKQPLTVIGHQISCWKCANAMTKYIQETGKTNA